jgi:outer membrane protein assembly factor BamB
MVVSWRVSFFTFAVNSRGEIILLDPYTITVIYTTGERKVVLLPDPPKRNVGRLDMSIAVDSNDNVYAVISDKDDFVLYAFDENNLYDVKMNIA